MSLQEADLINQSAESSPSPITAIHLLRTTDDCIQHYHPRGQLSGDNVNYGMLDGEDYYQLLFELSGIPKDMVLSHLQTEYRLGGVALDINPLWSASDLITRSQAKDVIGLAKAVCTFSKDKRQELLWSLQNFPYEQRSQLSRALDTYDQAIRRKVIRSRTYDRNMAVITKKANRRQLNDIPAEVVDSLFDAIENKWEMIGVKFVEVNH